MNTALHQEPAIVRGIKTAGVGKKGSKPLETPLIQEILAELKANRVSAVARGAFFGGLLMKGVSREENALGAVLPAGRLNDPVTLTEYLCPEAPTFVKECCISLLSHQTLSQPTARRLGQFLFSKEPGDGARGLVASILRVRYETLDEYLGLLQSIEETFEPTFKIPVPGGEPIIQVAEPFDGVDQSNLITPLLAQFLQNQSYRVVSLVGRNSGPKNGNNLLDLAKKLNARIVSGNQDLTGTRPLFGWYINQENLSRAMDHWVDLRRQIVKRPFLATLERFVNPVSARMIIASAFHPPYGEKMVSVCEQAGYPGIIIIRNGIEGTIAFPLLRPVKILCSVRRKKGGHLRQEFELSPQESLAHTVKVEEKIPSPSLEQNAELIRSFHSHGITANQLFNLRVEFTCRGVKKALDWINNHLAHE